MLPRSHRLTRKRDVERVSRKGRPVFGSLSTVRVLPGGAAETRFAIVASLKVSKSAVQRNRAKRLLREATRSLLVEVRAGFDIVVHAKPAIVGKPYRAVRDDVRNSLRRAKMIHSTERSAA